MTDLTLPYLTGRVGSKKWWNEPGAYATTLLTLFHDAFVAGQDDEPEDEGGRRNPYQWDPETIIAEVESEFGVEVHPVCRDKLLAAIALLTTDLFYSDVRIFIEICNVLSGDTFDPSTFDPAEPVECAWGMTEGMLIAHPDRPHEPFSREIVEYVRRACAEDGIIDPPDVLGIAGKTPFEYPLPEDQEGLNEYLLLAAVKSHDVTEAVRLRLKELFGQVTSLSLKNGDTKELAASVRKAMQQFQG